MEKIKRTERLGVMARLLTGSPNRVHTLSAFCEMFAAAKSTVSEDIDLLSRAFERFGQGELRTVAGAAGGVRYRATVTRDQAARALTRLARRLQDPSRILPGGFLYTSDITAETETAEMMGRILAQRYYDAAPDVVLTMETKGIPLALMTARMLDVPMVIARRDSGAYEGSSVKINYVAGSGGIETMTLARRSVAPGKRVLIIDDFMKGGGTLRGMMDMMNEFQAEVVGAAVMIATARPIHKRVEGAPSLLVLHPVDPDKGIVKIEASLPFA